MWFFEKAAVCVDTRTAAVAVYKTMPSGPRLLRFAFERFGSRPREGAPFKDVLGDSREAIARLVKELRAPLRDATILLPIGAAYPAIVDVKSLRKAQGAELDEEDLVRFRLAPLLPFPVSDAEIRFEPLGPASGMILGQAILRAAIIEGERVMASLGFPRVSVTSALSAALRGLKPEGEAVDLVFGDSACAIVVRNVSGAIESIHLRLLIEGDDRLQRSIDEAQRAAPATRQIRVLGEAFPATPDHLGDVPVQLAFPAGASEGPANPQEFPFLALFHEGARR